MLEGRDASQHPAALLLPQGQLSGVTLLASPTATPAGEKEWVRREEQEYIALPFPPLLVGGLAETRTFWWADFRTAPSDPASGTHDLKESLPLEWGQHDKRDTVSLPCSGDRDPNFHLATLCCLLNSHVLVKRAATVETPSLQGTKGGFWPTAKWELRSSVQQPARNSVLTPTTGTWKHRLPQWSLQVTPWQG